MWKDNISLPDIRQRFRQYFYGRIQEREEGGSFDDGARFGPAVPNQAEGQAVDQEGREPSGKVQEGDEEHRGQAIGRHRLTTSTEAEPLPSSDAVSSDYSASPLIPSNETLTSGISDLDTTATGSASLLLSSALDPDLPSPQSRSFRSSASPKAAIFTPSLTPNVNLAHFTTYIDLLASQHSSLTRVDWDFECFHFLRFDIVRSLSDVSGEAKGWHIETSLDFTQMEDLLEGKEDFRRPACPEDHAGGSGGW